MSEPKTDFSENVNPSVVAAAAAAAIQQSFRPANEITQQDRDNAVQLERHKIIIIKDPMTQIPTDIFGYELPVLFAIYGEDGIRVLDEFTNTVDVAGFDADTAFDRLHEKYGQTAGAAIQQIYPQGAYSLAQECGVASERPRGAQRARQKVTNLEIDHAVDSEADIAKQEVRILPPKTNAKKVTGAAAKETARTEKGKAIAAEAKASPAAKKAIKKAKKATK